MGLQEIVRLSYSCRAAVDIAFRAVVTLIVTTGILLAQTGGGATLVGTVKDATGAAVGGAKVTVVNTATSFIAETTTSAEGAYYVPYLTPGDYRVKVNSAGFKEFVREGITLRSAEVPRVDITLESGSVNDSVTVSAAASLLNTENVVSAYVLARGCPQGDSGRDEAHGIPAAVYARRGRRGGTGGLPHSGTGPERYRLLAGRNHRQVALYRHGEPGGWSDSGQHGRDGRSEGAHHRRFRGIRALGRRVDEDGVQVGNKLAACVF